MVNLKKPEKFQPEFDEEFNSFLARLDAFILEMHEENKRLAEIRELRQQNKMLTVEIQKLQNELRKKNNADDLENKTESDIKFERNLKINELLINILRFEVAAIIAFDIYFTFIK